VRERKAAFLDRDGTIIVDTGYIANPELVELLPGAADALCALGRDYALVIVSNQSGVARGLIRTEQLAAVHARMELLLAEAGVVLTSSYYCQHAPDAGCPCRKPAPGLLRQAAREHGFDLASSIMIGNRASDVEAGRAAGCATALLGDDDAIADVKAPSWPLLLAALRAARQC
jgi:histidinol-phosphate phosphatase family protein